MLRSPLCPKSQNQLTNSCEHCNQTFLGSEPIYTRFYTVVKHSKNTAGWLQTMLNLSEVIDEEMVERDTGLLLQTSFCNFDYTAIGKPLFYNYTLIYFLIALQINNLLQSIVKRTTTSVYCPLLHTTFTNRSSEPGHSFRSINCAI
jgi:hypothetical protein